MKAKGYAKDSAGFWAKGGKRIVIEILGFSIWATSGPILAEQLRKAGFESAYSQPPDWTNQAISGKFGGAWLFGHGASIADPYYTWPTVLNSYVNGAYWHTTFPLMLHKIKPIS
ncbi:MAG: hypothetical protein EB107_09210 [Proteobacteria bacterium]|nr:hypothetical protein [Pseudomonadota bacterium]